MQEKSKYAVGTSQVDKLLERFFHSLKAVSWNVDMGKNQFGQPVLRLSVRLPYDTQVHLGKLPEV